MGMEIWVCGFMRDMFLCLQRHRGGECRTPDCRSILWMRNGVRTGIDIDVRYSHRRSYLRVDTTRDYVRARRTQMLLGPRQRKRRVHCIDKKEWRRNETYDISEPPLLTPMSARLPWPQRLQAVSWTLFEHATKHTGVGIVCAVAYFDPCVSDTIVFINLIHFDIC